MWKLRIGPQPLSDAALDLHEAIRGDAFQEVEFMDLGTINSTNRIDALVDALQPAHEQGSSFQHLREHTSAAR